MRSYIQSLRDSLKRDGFTLMAESKPNVGHDVEAVRIIARRGFGGVALSTSRKIVPVTRTAENDYLDTLSNERCGYSEFDAWREFQTYKNPNPAIPSPGETT